jgi:prepilin-type processing-associated H-X9-DG protein
MKILFYTVILIVALLPPCLVLKLMDAKIDKSRTVIRSICNTLVVIFTFFYWAYLMVLFTVPRPIPKEKARRINCSGNLRQIGLALLMYSGENDRYFPNQYPNGANNLSVLNDKGYLADGMVYGCPSHRNPSMVSSNSDYIYVGSGLRDDDANPQTSPLAYDRSGNHPANAWINVLFVDGHVQGR